MNYKTKSVLVYDNGSFLPFAQRLSKDFGKVRYFSPWEDSSPIFKDTLIGKNMPGVERVDHFFDYLDESDIICFPDCTNGDLQLHLEACGYKVWGSRKGNELENDRDGMKDLLKKLKLPVGPYEVIKGTDKLRKYLKSHDNVFVKIDIFRGDFETFKSPNYRFIEDRITDLETHFGAARNEVIFIVEDELPDRVEIGYDGYCIDGKYPSKTLCGIEVKDLGYCGIVKDYDKLPEPLLEYNTKISPYLKAYGYKNFFSTEVRIGKDKKGYMIDNTTRQPSPPGELYQLMLKNFSEIIWEGANGNCVDPIFKAKFGVQIVMNSEWAKNNWLNVQWDKKDDDHVSLTKSTMINGEYFIVPRPEECDKVGSITYFANSLEEAMDNISEIAEEVKGYHLDIPSSSLDKAMEEFEKLKEIGYDLFK